MRVPLLLTLAVLAIVLWASEADGAPRDPRLTGVEDFAFALGHRRRHRRQGRAPERLRPGGARRGADRAEPRHRSSGNGGPLVLGYLSVGHDRALPLLVPHAGALRLPDRFEEFDEDYARVSARGLPPGDRRPDRPEDSRQGLRRALPRQHGHGREPSQAAKWDAAAGAQAGGARPRPRRPAVRPERRELDRPAAARPRRLEPRGRDLDLQLQAPPLRAPARRRRRGGAGGADADRRRGPAGDRDRLHGAATRRPSRSRSPTPAPRARSRSSATSR